MEKHTADRVLTIPMSIQGYNRTKDRCVSIRFKSNIEVESDVIKDIDSFLNKEGWLLYAENEISNTDIPKDQAPSEGKSQSKRLYDVLFVYWHHLKEIGDTTQDYNSFYDAKMEKIIEHFKEKLPERD